jgi:hypothetical protein
MKVRVSKIVYSDGTIEYYPQYLKWVPWGRYWYHMESENFPSLDRAVYDTEEEAWRYIRSKQNYPKVSYTYKENVE